MKEKYNPLVNSKRRCVKCNKIVKVPAWKICNECSRYKPKNMLKPARTAIILALPYMKMTYKDIAKKTGIPVSAVSVICYQLRQRKING